METEISADLGAILAASNVLMDSVSAVESMNSEIENLWLATIGALMSYVPARKPDALTLLEIAAGLLPAESDARAAVKDALDAVEAGDDLAETLRLLSAAAESAREVEGAVSERIIWNVIAGPVPAVADLLTPVEVGPHTFH